MKSQIRVWAMAMLLVPVLLAKPASAQSIHIGVKGGANINQIEGQSFDGTYKFGYLVGGFAELNLNKTIGLQPELLWVQAKATTTQDFNGFYGGFTGQNVSLNYLSIPVMFVWKPIPLFSFQLGPQFGVLINQSGTLFENSQRAFKTGDVSAAAGIQFYLGHFRLGGRYFKGLENMGRSQINGTSNQDDWLNGGFQFYLGITII
jgi:hypothetical protein